MRFKRKEGRSSPIPDARVRLISDQRSPDFLFYFCSDEEAEFSYPAKQRAEVCLLWSAAIGFRGLTALFPVRVPSESKGFCISFSGFFLPTFFPNRNLNKKNPKILLEMPRETASRAEHFFVTVVPGKRGEHANNRHERVPGEENRGDANKNRTEKKPTKAAEKC